MNMSGKGIYQRLVSIIFNQANKNLHSLGAKKYFSWTQKEVFCGLIVILIFVLCGFTFNSEDQQSKNSKWSKN